MSATNEHDHSRLAVTNGSILDIMRVLTAHIGIIVISPDELMGQRNFHWTGLEADSKVTQLNAFLDTFDQGPIFRETTMNITDNSRQLKLLLINLNVGLYQI